MVESNGKHYVGGKVQMLDNCDLDRWSKLEVDDVLEKLGIDVSKFEYCYLNPGMRLDDGLVRLFDNISAVEMAEIGVQKGVVDVYAVEANEVVESQITQEIDVGGVSRLDDIGLGTVRIDMGDEPDDRVHTDFEGCESGNGGESESGEIGVGDRLHSDFEDFEGCESGKGSESEDGEIGAVDNLVGKVKGKETEKAKASGKGKEKATRKENVIDGVRIIVGEDDQVEDPSFFDSDYDLSDHDEDAIMAGQVEGWKKVMDEMVNDHMGDTCKHTG